MKFKALRTKREPKEFITIGTVENTMIMYTCALPDCKPLTATLEDMKEYYEKYYPIPDTITLDDLEMIEFEMFEADTVGADIRNKLTPPLNLVALLKLYFKEKDEEKRKTLKKFIEKEMGNSEKSIKYISKLL
jgi:hypothetical protein